MCGRYVAGAVHRNVLPPPVHLAALREPALLPATGLQRRGVRADRLDDRYATTCTATAFVDIYGCIRGNATMRKKKGKAKVLLRLCLGWALCGHEAPAGTADTTDGPSCAAEDQTRAYNYGSFQPHPSLWGPSLTQNSAATGAAEHSADAKAAGSGGIPRPRRIAVGQKCKALIDRGRLEWLQESGFQVTTMAWQQAAH